MMTSTHFDSKKPIATELKLDLSFDSDFAALIRVFLS